MTYAYSVMKVKNVDNVSTDRIIKLSPIAEKVLDTRKRSTFMFREGQIMHAILESGLWRLEYRKESGNGQGFLPEPLKQRWTNFNQLMKFLRPYFEARGVKVEEVIA